MNLIDKVVANPGKALILIVCVILIGTSAEIRMILSFFLFFGCLVAILIGLYQPSMVIRWHVTPSRWHVAGYGLVGAFIFFHATEQAVSSIDRSARASKASRYHEGNRLLLRAQGELEKQSLQTALELFADAKDAFRDADSLAKASVVESRYDSLKLYLSRLEEENRRFEEQKRLEREETPVVMSSSALYTEYHNNEVRADENYKGRLLIIWGVIEEIRSGGVLSPMSLDLRVNEHSWDEVNCYFKEERRGELIPLQKGQVILVGGTCNGLTLGDPSLSKCFVIGPYSKKLVRLCRQWANSGERPEGL